jgi:MFS family permease
MLPDLVPEMQRGEASGYVGLMTILGNAASFALAAVLLGSINATAASASEIRSGVALYYVISGLVLGLGALITVLWVHETPYEPYSEMLLGGGVGFLSAELVKPGSQRLPDWMALWITPWQKRDFTLVFLTRTSVMLGITLFMTFIEYYFATVAQANNFVQETAALAVLALGGAAASAFVLGIVSDRLRTRLGRVPLVCASTLCMSVAAVSFVIFPSGIPLWPMGLLFGAGLGAYFSVDWALAVDVLPSSESFGKDMGIWSMATTLPAIIAPLVGAVVLNIAGAAGNTPLGYRIVFTLAVGLLLLGAICVLLVRNELGAKGGGSQKDRSSAHSAGASRKRRHVRAGWRLAARTRAGHARGFMLFWPFWEFVTTLVHPQHHIPAAPFDLLRVQFTRFHGPAITLPDGTRVQSGDQIGEIHLHNSTLASVAEQANSWQLLRMLMGDLGGLAEWSHSADFPADIRAFYGYTILSRGASRLGFTLRTRPSSLRTWLDGFFLTGLLVLYNPRGRGRLSQGTTYGTEPVEVWMSRAELERRYDHSPEP